MFAQAQARLPLRLLRYHGFRQARQEGDFFPNGLRVKVAFSGCPNDCPKVRMHGFGIIGMTLPQYNTDRCVNCGAGVRYCRRKSVEALATVNCKVTREHRRCIGCGECVLNCPTGAWTRSEQRFYRLALFGRTGRKNLRLAEDFIKWASEDAIVRIIINTYECAKEYTDRDASGGKERIGYIVDRTGFDEYLRWAMKGVTLPAEAEVASRLYWGGNKY